MFAKKLETELSSGKSQAGSAAGKIASSMAGNIKSAFLKKYTDASFDISTNASWLVDAHLGVRWRKLLLMRVTLYKQWNDRYTPTFW